MLTSKLVAFIEVLLFATLVYPEEILKTLDGSSFPSTPRCGNSPDTNGKWCFEPMMTQLRVCGNPTLAANPGSGSIPSPDLGANREVISTPVRLPDDLDEFLLSLKFSISSCDENVLSSKSDCSEELKIELIGQLDHSPNEVALFSKTETTALGTALSEIYSVNNREKFRYIRLKLTSGTACVTVESIQIKAEKCLSEVANLVRFQSAYASESKRHSGKCVENSVLNGKNQPLKKCSHGNWFSLIEANCVCEKGFFFESEKCKACGPNEYKNVLGKGPCSRCAPFSFSGGGAHTCTCNRGYFHNPASVSDPNCYKMPLSPRVWKVTNATNEVSLNYSVDSFDPNVRVEVTCVSCVDLRPRVHYSSDKRSAVVSGLSENTVYRLRVAAVNQVSSLDLQKTSIEVTVKTKKSHKVRVLKCVKSYDKLLIEWDPINFGESDSEPPPRELSWSYLGSRNRQSVAVAPYLVQIRPENSRSFMDFYTNDTKFQTSNLNPDWQYIYKVGLKNDPKSFSQEVVCSVQGTLLSKAQIQGITVLVGAVSIVFIALLTVLFIVFCYYKKKREEFLYSSCAGFTAPSVFDQSGDLKNMSPIYSHCANNTGKYFYGATSGGLAGGTGLNQYHMGDIYGSAIIAAKRGYQYSKNGTQDMSNIPLTSTGIDLFLEASQYYDSYDSMLHEFARDVPCSAVTIDSQSSQNTTQNQHFEYLNGLFGPGLVLSKGSLLVGDKQESKPESVRIVRLTEKASDDDQKILAMQVMTMSNFTHPNVLMMHGVTFTSDPLCCVMEEPDLGPLHIVLSQMTSQLKHRSSSQSNSTDYLKISNLSSSGQESSVEHGATSPSSGKSSESSSCSNYGKLPGNTVDVPELLHLLRGIASGMQYLHDGGVYVHKVLCSMNVSVTKHRMCKVGGFDMRCALEMHSYNAVSPQSGTGGTLTAPVPSHKLTELQTLLAPWTALEVFEGSLLSQQSDVWSFGTVMWHVFSLAQHQPFFDWNQKEIVRMLFSGYRLPPPDNCPDQVYELMMACWSLNPISRPPFSLIREVIEKLICSSAPQSTSLNCTSTLSSSSSPYTNAATIGNDLRGQVQQSYIGNVSIYDGSCESSEKFLYEIGLGQYTPLFEQALILKVADIAVLSNKTLKDLGVTSSKDRKKILERSNSVVKSTRISSLNSNSTRHNKTSFIPQSTLQRVL